MQFSKRGRQHAFHKLLFTAFVLFLVINDLFFVGGLLVKGVFQLIQLLLCCCKLRLAQPTGAHIFDHFCQFFGASFKRTQQGVGGASQTPLEDAHGKASRGAVEQASAII